MVKVAINMFMRLCTGERAGDMVCSAKVWWKGGKNRVHVIGVT